MNVFLVAMQIFGYLVAHKDAIKQAILDLEALVPDGAAKAQAFKAGIAAALGIEDKIEAAWPIVSPIFNAIVAGVKGKAPAAA